MKLWVSQIYFEEEGGKELEGVGVGGVGHHQTFYRIYNQNINHRPFTADCSFSFCLPVFFFLLLLVPIPAHFGDYYIYLFIYFWNE